MSADNHPTLVVKRDLTRVSPLGPWDFDLTAISIVDGHTVNCSAKYDGLSAIAYEQAATHLIIAFWQKGTGPAIWEEAVKHIATTLTNNPLYLACRPR